MWREAADLVLTMVQGGLVFGIVVGALITLRRMA